MTKKEIFKAVKEANIIADQMADLAVGSAEYNQLSEELNWTLDPLFYDKRRSFSLHLSQRTGHYYVRFA